MYHKMLRLIGVCYYVYYQKLFVCLLYFVTSINVRNYWMTLRIGEDTLI
jgi:hypothetical protein